MLKKFFRPEKLGPKILTIIFLSFVILQTSAFLFLNLFHFETQASVPGSWAEEVPNWSMPELKIDIPGLKNFANPTACPDDPTKTCIPWIGEYIAGIYKYAVGIAGILATAVLMFGGVVWLTAGGNASRITEAKTWIGASLTGLVLVVSSYMILYMINPKLTLFSPLKISTVKESSSKTCYWSAPPCPESLGFKKAESNALCQSKEKKSGFDPNKQICCCSIGSSKLGEAEGSELGNASGGSGSGTGGGVTITFDSSKALADLFKLVDNNPALNAIFNTKGDSAGAATKIFAQNLTSLNSLSNNVNLSGMTESIISGSEAIFNAFKYNPSVLSKAIYDVGQTPLLNGNNEIFNATSYGLSKNPDFFSWFLNNGGNFGDTIGGFSSLMTTDPVLNSGMGDLLGTCFGDSTCNNQIIINAGGVSNAISGLTSLNNSTSLFGNQGFVSSLKPLLSDPDGSGWFFSNSSEVYDVLDGFYQKVNNFDAAFNISGVSNLTSSMFSNPNSINLFQTNLKAAYDFISGMANLSNATKLLSGGTGEAIKQAIGDPDLLEKISFDSDQVVNAFNGFSNVPDIFLPFKDPDTIEAFAFGLKQPEFVTYFLANAEQVGLMFAELPPTVKPGLCSSNGTSCITATQRIGYCQCINTICDCIATFPDDPAIPDKPGIPDLPELPGTNIKQSNCSGLDNAVTGCCIYGYGTSNCQAALITNQSCCETSPGNSFNWNSNTADCACPPESTMDTSDQKGCCIYYDDSNQKAICIMDSQKNCHSSNYPGSSHSWAGCGGCPTDNPQPKDTGDTLGCCFYIILNSTKATCVKTKQSQCNDQNFAGEMHEWSYCANCPGVTAIDYGCCQYGSYCEQTTIYGCRYKWYGNNYTCSNNTCTPL